MHGVRQEKFTPDLLFLTSHSALRTEMNAIPLNPTRWHLIVERTPKRPHGQGTVSATAVDR